jgi:[acyl-carrier-protein] S-malonyltransferase
MVSYIFPGQGSQSLGMGQWLYQNFKEAKIVFEEASDILKQDMKALCFASSDQELALTENTQPAIVLVSRATEVVLLKEIDIKPVYVAGHSVGEYSAAVACGAIAFSDALSAVRVRGIAMQNAVPQGEGGMAAVLGVDNLVLENICSSISQTTQKVLSIANYNCPGQSVISGHKIALKYLEENNEKVSSDFGLKKIKFITLNVSAPFHCSLMEPAQRVMESCLNELKWSTPRIPLIQNIDSSANTNPKIIKDNLIKQVSGSVQWENSIRKLLDLGVTHFIECGSGKVLSGLGKKIDSSRSQVLNINSLDDLANLNSFGRSLTHAT